MQPHSSPPLSSSQLRLGQSAPTQGSSTTPAKQHKTEHKHDLYPPTATGRPCPSGPSPPGALLVGTQLPSTQTAPGFLTAILLLDPLGAQDAKGAAGLAVGGQRAAQLDLLVVVAAIQKAGLVKGQGVQEAVAGLEEAFHVRQLQAVAVALQLLDLDVVAGGSVLRVLQLVAAVGTRRVEGALVVSSPAPAPTQRARAV